MYENLRKNVRAAVSSGVQFRYHVGIEEHLAYARRLHALACVPEAVVLFSEQQPVCWVSLKPL